MNSDSASKLEDRIEALIDALPKYFGHVLVGGYLAAIPAAFLWNASGMYSKHFAPSPIAACAAPLVTGSGAALLLKKHAGWRACLSFLIPLGIFLAQFCAYGTDPATLVERNNTYFGPDCSGSECLYVLSATIPMFASLSYSITSFLLKLRAEQKRDSSGVRQIEA